MDIFQTPSGGRADSARAAAASHEHSWVAAPQLAMELGISRRTLTRWLHDTPLRFPRPRIVNKRLYFERGAVDCWKAEAAVTPAWLYHGPFVDEGTARANYRNAWKASYRWARIMRRQASPMITHRQASL